MMMKTQYFISVERLFKLRLKLGDVIGKIENQFQRRFFQDLLDILLLELTPNYDDIQKKGIYKALILGTGDLSIINGFVGVNTSDLLSNDSSYLISIRRTFRDQYLTIEFLPNTNLSEKDKDVIASVFRRKNPEVDINRFLKTSQIPSLIIKNFNLSSLESFDDDIKYLKSTNLIQKIILNLNYSSGDSIYSLFNSVDIIPQGYNFLNDLNISELKNNFHESELYNFIILNDRNDFLIKAFFDFFILYENKFDIKGDSYRKVLENIFYVFETNILNETRFLKEKEYIQYQERIQAILFKTDINYRRYYPAILLALKYLQDYIFRLIKNSDIERENHSLAAQKLIQKTGDLLNYFKSFPETHESLKTKLYEFKKILNQSRKTQIKIIKKIVNVDGSIKRIVLWSAIDRELFEIVTRFSELYNPSLDKEIKDFIKQQRQEYTKYLEKHNFLGIETYYKNDIDYELYIVSIVVSILEKIENYQKVNNFYDFSFVEERFEAAVQEFQNVYKSKTHENVLFELSELLSGEILSIMIDLGLEQQDGVN